MHLRPGVPADLPRLTEIYNHYVTNSYATFDTEPFTVDERRSWFSHYAQTGPHRLLVAAPAAGEVLGYATSSPFRPKSGYATTVELTVYVSPDADGRGIGSALYTRLLADLAGEDLHRAVAGIALPNDASVALHRRFDFTSVGVYTEVGRKFGRYFDVGWYQRPLGPAPTDR